MASISLTEGRFAHVLKCPICLETFKRPKVLSCGHTYCVSCLQSHINSTLINMGTPQICFPCPVCRVETSLPQNTANVEQCADLFPVNSIVSSILDINTETFGEKLCCMCLKWNRRTSAKSFCKDCKRLMCKICEEHHNETVSCISHEVLDWCRDDESFIRIPNLSSIDKCLKHLSKNIEFLCMDHNSLCCNRCGFLEHRKCERVIPIDDMLKKFDSNAKSKYLETNIHIIEDHIKHLASKVKEISDSIKQDKTTILQRIRSLRAELNAKLHKLEDDLIASLEAYHKTEELTLHNQETRGLSLISVLSSDLTQLDLVMTHGSEVQKIIMLHNMEKNQNRYFKAMTEYQDDLKFIKVGLEINENLNKLMNDLKEFGEITVTRYKTNLPPLPKLASFRHKTDTVSESNRTYLKDRKAVKISEFSLKEAGDNSSCFITDIVLLERGKNIFVDCYNQKIKIYGESGQLQESLSLQGRPCNACILPDYTMGVTLPINKTILVIGIDDKMHKIREIKTRLQCWGIAVMKDQLVITTAYDGHSVLILDINGSEIRTFQPDNYQSEGLLLPFYIKINKPETTIYISYNNGDKMVAFNTVWDVMFTYTNKDMKEPCGIDTDREGNVYLCGCSSFNVQQISADGNLIKELINQKEGKEEDKKNPLRIKFYRDIDRFILTYADCDTADVYDMNS